MPLCFCANRMLINVIILGLSFLLIFSAFQTSSMFEITVLNEAASEPNSTFTGSGSTSLAIIYITFAFANWVSPLVVVWLTPKYSMFVSAIIYVLFIASFLYPMNWSLYLGSFLVGVAAAVLWTAQGNALSINSISATIGRNTTIFWAIFQCSLVFGNIFQYVMFRKAKGISDSLRTTFYIVFTVVGSIGTFLILCLRNPDIKHSYFHETLSETDLLALNRPEKFSAFQSFFQSFRLIKTKIILLLLCIFAYSGFELTFFSGVYGTSVGQTKAFGDKAIGYVGLTGIMIGIGEITSSVLITIFTRLWKGFNADLIIVIGLTTHIISYFLIFLSLPFDSPIKASLGVTYIYPSVPVIIICGYLLGFGDSIFNTQIMSLLGDAYKGVDSPSAFALFYFMKTYNYRQPVSLLIPQLLLLTCIVSHIHDSLASGIAFFYCKVLTLQWQLLILAITGILGTISFIFGESKTRVIIQARNIDESIIAD